MDEVVSEFLVESYENLDQLDEDLLALERDPSDKDRIASVFRTVHTVKGTCGFLGFSRLESVTHAGENLLSLLRDGEITIDAEIASTLLALGDAVRGILATIEATSEEGENDYAELVATLKRLQQRQHEDAEQSESPADDEAGDYRDHRRRDRPTPNAVEAPVAEDAVAAATPPAAKTPAAEQPKPQGGADQPRQSAAESTIRVDVGLLDELMNLVGELVLARNQIVSYTSTHSDSTIISTTQRLNLITSELQEGVMKTRMQAIGTIWSRFPRIVRDLAHACGKQVRVEMTGEETELDRSILEAIKDPLTHLVRNAVDHGIETPEARTAAGRDPEGTLLLRALHEGGQVHIEIADDGAGIDADKIRRKGVERGLVSEEAAAQMSEREALMLIFQPGFSTAEQVTNVSGRGVGMDVVKTNIERIGGTVEVQTKKGEGTTFRVKIPLTLAIIPALTVRTGTERYAIPQVNLIELVRLAGDEAAEKIENIHGAPVYRLRGNLLPLVHLDRELEMDREHDAARTVNIVVLQADGRQFGLVVDEVVDTQEIVVKPLDRQLQALPVYAGATIMGDGAVALILDVMGLAQRAKLVSDSRQRSRVDDAERFGDTGDADVLLIAALGDRRVAMPLSLVARLEEFPEKTVENSSGREVVQYRGGIMPLVSLASALGIPPAPWTGEEDGESVVNVVVYDADGRNVGLVVDAIVDIVTDRRRRDPSDESNAVVIDRRVTDLIDVPSLVAGLESTLFGEPSSYAIPTGV